MATILVLDDRETNREFLTTLLSYTGHTLLEAASADEALTITRSARPDLIIADVLMPDSDGFDFVRQLRAEPAIAHTRVIFYTATYIESETRALAASLHVAHLLTKPSEPQIILETIRQTLDNPVVEVAPPPTERFEQEHQRLLLSKLTQKIEELEQLNVEMRTSRAQLQAALDVGGMGIWLLTLPEAALRWDAMALKIWGFDTNDEAPQTLAALLDHIHPDDRADIRAEWDRMIATNGSYAGEFRILLPDGSARWLASHVGAEPEAGQLTRQMIGVHMDITTRKHAEEAQFRSQKVEALGTLAGGIAHDFNNILLAIAGNTELASLDLPDAHPVQFYLNAISKASERATELVRRILTFSRPQEHKRSIIQLPSIVNEAILLVRAAMPTQIKLQTQWDEDLPAINADANQIHQILVNLLTNAAHAIGNTKGSITIQIHATDVDEEFASTHPRLRAGRYTCLTISDTGCGMEPATIARIFDPFFTTKPIGQGTGLGLSVVHGIIQSHGGAIFVESQPGKGSTFQLFFPVALAEEAPESAATPTSAGPAHEHVLYIDDDESLLVPIKRLLALQGYTVSTYTSPREALQAFRAQPQTFDIVISDILMPDITGFELAREVRALRPDIPIMLVSGYIRAEDQQRAEQIGINEIVLKPQLLKQIESLIKQLTLRSKR